MAAMKAFLMAVALLGCVSSTQAAQANPIRKVVTMLQSMQAKVEAEGKKEEELYEKFMCYCKTSGGDLQASIDSAGLSIEQLGKDIETSTSLKAETEEALKQAQDDRAAAKTAMAEATAVREKEAAAFAATKSEADVNIAALTKATAAVEKGMGSAFLQTSAAGALRKLLTVDSNLEEEDKETLTAFLSAGQNAEYAPQSGQILGILKMMGDEMAKNLADATAAEEAAIKNYDTLMSAKTEEVSTLSAGIEAKLDKIAELGVAIAQMKNDLTDTEEALVADKAFLAELESSCKTKTAEWEEIKKTRSEELLALADTIKILNDDDALDLFKKTLPSASSSFVQVAVSSASMRTKAYSMLSAMRAKATAQTSKIDVILLALHGKKIGFDKVIKMIDEMVATLKTEQQADDNKKEYCEEQFDITDDKKKATERLISDKETAIAAAKDSITQLTEEIAALKKGIAALDKDVAEATEQRKAENADYKDLMSNDGAAKEILGFAKNRLNKFYNPKLYKEPTGEAPASFVQIRAHVQLKGKAAPPPPPETFGAYKKKGEEGTGVIGMIDLLVADLDKEMTEAEATEKDAQADYEALMKDSAEKRTADSKSITEKEQATADTEAALEKYTDDKKEAQQELTALLQFIQALHADCDFLIKYFDVRKEARTSEIEALGSAKAVLSGADYSLIQTRSRYLRRAV